jgi:hypothetical protein
MLQAFAEYKTNYPASTLSILGSGPLESKLKLIFPGFSLFKIVKKF